MKNVFKLKSPYTGCRISAELKKIITMIAELYYIISPKFDLAHKVTRKE